MYKPRSPKSSTIRARSAFKLHETSFLLEPISSLAPTTISSEGDALVSALTRGCMSIALSIRHGGNLISGPLHVTLESRSLATFIVRDIGAMRTQHLEGYRHLRLSHVRFFYESCVSGIIGFFAKNNHVRMSFFVVCSLEHLYWYDTRKIMRRMHIIYIGVVSDMHVVS